MAEALKPGTLLQGVYEVRKQIGAGGGGTIYLGYHTHLKTEIAIKKIHDKGKYDENEVFREAKILTQLRHSYLPRVYDFLILDSGVYTVMDFIPGQSIEQMIKSGHKFTEKEVIKFGTQLSEVLSYLHSQKPAIIHGDIKPANIMVTPDNNVCLIDFNISGMADEKGNAYVMGYSAGYAAPEQFEEYKEIVQKLSEAKAAWKNSQSSAPAPRSNAGETVSMDDVFGNETVSMADVYNNPNETYLMPDSDDPDATLLMPEYYGEQAKEQKAPEPEKSQAPSMSSLGIKGIHIDPSSDVYSVGATMYHMLTGEKVGESKKKPTLKISDGFIIVLNKALEENRSKRYKDAGELLQAFRGVYKLDKRYKRVIAAQQLVQSLFIIMIGAGVVLSFYGKRVSANEQVKLYHSYVEQIVECGDSGDLIGAEEAYIHALSIDSSEMDAYSAMTGAMFASGDYEGTIDFIETDITSHSYLASQSSMDYIYYVLGRSYFETEDFANASLNIEKAIALNNTDSDYYIFDALSLARAGIADKAHAALDKAVSLNASREYVLLLQGELSKAEGNSEKAAEYFNECISVVEDEYIKSRAYIFYSDLYKVMDQTDENLRKQIAILEKAENELALEYKTLVLSRLAQAYMNLYNLTGDRDTAIAAADVYKRIAKVGIADFGVYNNIVVLYEQCGMYAEAKETLESVEKLYSGYYGFYKRLAFLEFRIQNEATSAMDMSFDNFEAYYQKAEELYADVADKNDTEMLYLEQTYQNYKAIMNQ